MWLVGLAMLVVPFLTEFLKKTLWVEGKASIAILSIVLWVLYILYTQTVPVEWQDKIWSLVLAVASVSMLIYEFVIKEIQKKKR